MASTVLTIQQLTSPGYAESMSEASGDATVVLSDGSKVVMPLRLALMNGMLWTPYVEFNVPITKDRIFWIKAFTNETVIECGSKIYSEMVLILNMDHLQVLSSIWCSMNRIFYFVHQYCRNYYASIDALSLSRLCMRPDMREVCQRGISEKIGIRAAEQAHTQITNDLHNILKKNGGVLAPFVKTKLLKRNQIPQMFASYGPRSDIDDTMFKHVISANAFSGLSGIEDFTIEYSSAKKAQFFNNSVIRKAQYFARRCRLGASRISKVYRGSCGSTVTFPIVIDPRKKGNYLGKYIQVTPEEFKKYDTDKIHLYDDCSIMLTPENIDQFAGKEVHMWSPFGCRHTDGVCEHCAGFMSQRMEAFIPPGVQLGVYGATRMVSAVTQKILSAKHLIKTSSKEFVLNQQALRYLSKNSDALFWQISMASKLKKCKARILVEGLGPISDLEHETIPSGEAWSQIDFVEIIGPEGNSIDRLEITDWTIQPYFSNYMMRYLKQRRKDLTIRSLYIDIPLDTFDFKQPVFKYTAVNDDMVSFVSAVDQFLSGSICDYRSIPKCVEDFSRLVYSKTDVNIFYIEMMLRAFLIDPNSSDHGIPVITDPNQMVEFEKLSAMISGSALSTKLSFERLDELFCSGEACCKNIGTGTYGFNDAHFNFSEVV